MTEPERTNGPRLCAVDGCDQPMPLDDNSTACRGHWNRLEQTLGEMPKLVEDLNITITKQARVYLESTGQRAIDDADDPQDIDPKGLLPGLQGLRPQPTTLAIQPKPLPFHLGAAKALEDLHRTLWWWVREGIEAHPDMAFRGSPTAVGLSRALLALHGWLQGHPEGYLAIEAITDDVKAASHAIDSGQERWYAGVCGHIGENDTECTEDLYGTKDHETVTCPVCTTTYDLAERRWTMLGCSGDTELTLTEMTSAIALTGAETVTRKQLEGWVRRGKLVRAGNNGPIATYRVADVEALVRPMRQEA